MSEFAPSPLEQPPFTEDEIKNAMRVFLEQRREKMKKETGSLRRSMQLALEFYEAQSGRLRREVLYVLSQNPEALLGPEYMVQRAGGTIPASVEPTETSEPLTSTTPRSRTRMGPQESRLLDDLDAEEEETRRRREFGQGDSTDDE